MLKLEPGTNKFVGNWPKWGSDPHNPWSGQHRPAFNWRAFERYARGEVDANGDPIKEAKSCARAL